MQDYCRTKTVCSPENRDDGTTTTIRQRALEMQQEMAEVTKMADAHEVATTCFLATGGAE